MAQTTIGTFLMYREIGGTKWEKLVDIKDYADLGGVPEKADASTLSNRQRVYKNTIQDVGEMQFTANYNRTEYVKLREMMLSNKEYEFGVWFDEAATYGEDGYTLEPNEASSDKHTFTGNLSVYAPGGSVGEIRNMIISLSNSSDIDFEAGTTTV